MKTFLKSDKQKGVAYIIIAALCFSFMNAFVRLAGDVPSIQKSFFRNIVAFVFALIIIIKNKGSFKIEKGNFKFLFLRSFFGTIGILCNFYAVDHLVISDASLLNKMSPFFAIIFSFLILREKTTLKQAAVVIGAFLGSLLIIKPSFANADFLPSLVGLCGGMGAGIAYTMVRILGKRGQHGSFVVLFFSGFSSLVTLPFLIFDYHYMNLTQVAMLFLAGLSAAGGQFSITAAYMHAPAKEISVYDYSQIVFSAILGILMFAQVPDYLSVLGYIVIICMGVLNAIINNKK